jgi:hypothetical protein
MELLSDDKLKTIFDKLDNIKPGLIYAIADPDDIPYIKQYADTHRNITFNNDYTKIRKDEY